MQDLLEFYQHTSQQRAPDSVRATLLPMLTGLSRALGFERAVVALYDADRDMLRGSVTLNVSETLAESLDVPVSDRDHPFVQALLEGAPQRVDDVRTDPRFLPANRELLAEMG